VRLRGEVAAPAAVAASGRLSIARRSPLEASAAASNLPVAPPSAAAPADLDLKLNIEPSDSDVDLGPSFDVPAFLRRQEG